MIDFTDFNFFYKNWKDENGNPWSVQRDGIPSDAMRNVKVICSENAHFSVQKNMAMMGMGFQSVVTVPVNENAQMDVVALKQTMANLKAEGKIVACTGFCDTNMNEDIKRDVGFVVDGMLSTNKRSNVS